MSDVTVGRPTDAELDRMEELVDEYFVGDNYAIKINCWDDGDVHLTAYSTIGTNCSEGYPMEVLEHRQIIEYKRDDETCLYRNFVRREWPGPNQELDRERIEF